ncbi:dihydrolipoamide dehydrogenase [Verrucomicrobium sp. GAS474]|uniref:dihydrolipoyl dehydrogenase n=1 Tax=Verrucomicrobium sp. GAS474 TaxID=1882831 RepID=UPI00087922DB|nr:dihydrolipoyl dehydrogenase [Verrucomicrobium sp. GAS474]SDT91319.1 dihydrolipoamide dehydrogenase [Verrucomicrobium sp. GAS474]
MSYDLVVIGGGPAGYVGAIRAAQLGKKVACVEVERAGGTCLNWGCIPTKALLKSADFYHQAKRAEEFGFKIGKIEFDFAKVMARSRGVSDQMAKGIESLFRSKKVDYLVGRGQITPDKKVIVTAADGTKQTLEAKNILLATGCTPKALPGLKPDGKKIFSSREILAIKEQPKSIIILGAGAIGVEFAHFLNAFGTKVTLVEMMPNILPIEDEEVSRLLGRTFVKNGIEVLTNTKVEKTEVTATGVKITTSSATGEAGTATSTYEADTLLVAIGVQANTEGLFAAGVAPELDRGFLKTNGSYQTSIPGVYGAGDIVGPPWLAHVASHEAVEAVEGIFVPGKKPKKVELFPGCTYCSPQVASIGLTEKKAKEKGLKYKVGKFPYVASGRAVAVGEPEGFVKLIVAEPHGEILGAHIIGSEATELIAELGLAMTLEATVDEIHSTIHAHPTLSEMIAEATLAAQGHPIHI